jgi:diguanylate cyclase (GGDEF)-like protein
MIGRRFATRPRPVVPPIATAALVFAAVVIVLQLVGVGTWRWQVLLHHAAGPPLIFVAAVFAYLAMGRATIPGARRHWGLMSLALAIVCIGDLLSLTTNAPRPVVEFPLFVPAIQVMNLIAVILAVVALLSIPPLVRWSTSRLRVGLDMVTVLLGGAVFLWYFSVGPTLERDAGLLPELSSLVQAAGVLVLVFVVARVVFTGARGVRRPALAAMGAGGLIEVVAEALLPLLDRSHLHVTFAITGAFRALLIIGTLLQLLSEDTSSTPAPKPPRTFSVLPFAAVAATDALLVAAYTRAADARTGAVLAGAIVLTGLVATRQIVALRDNAELVDSLRQAMSREQVLAELGTALMTAKESAAIHHLAVTAAARLVAAWPAAASIVVPAPDASHAWQIVAAAGTGAEGVEGKRVTAARLPNDVIARLRAGEVVADVDPAALGVTAAGRAVSTRTVLLLPLVAGGRFFAVLTVSAPERLPDDVHKSLETLRTQAALALESAVLTAELTEQATHDPLTGLPNRTLVRHRMEVALSQAEPDGAQVGVLLLDLDGFKQINDTLGHAAGDQVLRVVAERLAGCLRAEDPAGRLDSHQHVTATAGRLGGDEFVVLVENLTDPTVATMVAERINATLSQPVAVGEHRLRVQASIGIALSGPAVDGPDRLLRIADSAMYESKRFAKRDVPSDGRNRVTAATVA